MQAAKSGTDYARICAKYNLPISKNQIGDSGEKILGFALSYFPFFNLYFLDGKAPVEDFFGEIPDEKNPYPFLIQVKTTEKGEDAKGNLQTTLPRDKKMQLINRPVPAYLAGIDLHKIKLYLCPVFDPSLAYSTILPNHVIDFDDLDKWAYEIALLKEDVIAFWENQTNATTQKSKYKSKL